MNSCWSPCRCAVTPYRDEEWLNSLESRGNYSATSTKCIGNDTKAADSQSLNCIKKQKKIKYGEKRFSICRMEFLHPAMWHVALESRQWIHQVAAPCNVIRGSGMTCHSIRPNVRHVGILLLVSISTHHRSRHVILYQSAKFYPNWTTLGRKKWCHVDFWRWRISAILECRDPIMGSLKSPVKLT